MKDEDLARFVSSLTYIFPRVIQDSFVLYSFPSPIFLLYVICFNLLFNFFIIVYKFEKTFFLIINHNAYLN